MKKFEETLIRDAQSSLKLQVVLSILLGCAISLGLIAILYASVDGINHDIEVLVGKYGFVLVIFALSLGMSLVSWKAYFKSRYISIKREIILMEEKMRSR
jgi:hypothetical protein